VLLGALPILLKDNCPAIAFISSLHYEDIDSIRAILHASISNTKKADAFTHRVQYILINFFNDSNHLQFWLFKQNSKAIMKMRISARKPNLATQL
jgi:hypothetical protein